MPVKNTRIKDIARMAGVSIGTVDRVIHYGTGFENKKTVSPGIAPSCAFRRQFLLAEASSGDDKGY
jgi:transposase